MITTPKSTIITNIKARKSLDTNTWCFVDVNQEWFLALLATDVVIGVRSPTVVILIGSTISYAHTAHGWIE